MIGTKKNLNAVKPDWLTTFESFYFKTHALQSSQVNHLRWGFTEPFFVCTLDQIPIALCPSHVTTVEHKGVTDVYDCANTNKDVYRFCNLNLAGHMKLNDDKSNLTKAHILFQVTSFKEGKYWGDKDDVAKWNTRVIILFQENTWVEARTRIYGLK